MKKMYAIADDAGNIVAMNLQLGEAVGQRNEGTGRHILQSAEHNGGLFWKLFEKEIDFVVDGVGYSQDSDCDTWKWNLQTLKKSRISDNTYCAAFDQYQAAKKGLTYKPKLDELAAMISFMIGYNVGQKEIPEPEETEDFQELISRNIKLAVEFHTQHKQGFKDYEDLLDQLGDFVFDSLEAAAEVQSND